MLKTLLSIIVEVIVAICVSGLILAAVVPLVHRYRPYQPGSADIVATGVVVVVILGVIAAVLFRPGSAINRWVRR